MKKKLLFACFVIALASCTKEELNEMTNRKIIAVPPDIYSTGLSDDGFNINNPPPGNNHGNAMCDTSGWKCNG